MNSVKALADHYLKSGCIAAIEIGAGGVVTVREAVCVGLSLTSRERTV